MQSNKNPDLLITDAKTGKLMKVFVNLTLVDGDDHQLESQHKVENSKNCHCHFDDESLQDICNDYGDHCHGEVACDSDIHHCDDDMDDDETSYIFSHCESGTVSPLIPHCEDNCGKEEEKRWKKVWSTEAGAFEDIECQQECTLLDHRFSPDKTPRQNTFETESVFQNMGLKPDEKKHPIDGLYNSHLNNIWVNFLESQLKCNPPLDSAPPNPPNPPADPLRPVSSQLPTRGCMQHTPTNLPLGRGTPTSVGANAGKVVHSGGVMHGAGRGRGRGGSGGGGGGAGGGGGGGGPTPGATPRGQNITLNIKTAPRMWGVTELNHTKANCNDKWLETFVDYFQFIENDWEEEFEWINNQGQLNGTTDDRNSDLYKVTQYIAMLIVWIGREDIPGSHDAHDQADLFTYKSDGFIDSSQQGYNVGAILNSQVPQLT